jgi:hypothetical protein
MEKVQAFKTTDGTLFDNVIQAERHEMFLEKDMVVEEFLDSELNQYKAMTSRSIARTTVINWELWKVKNAAK